jgi:hypothetical protein
MTTGVKSSWIGDSSKKLYCQPTKMEQIMECLVTATEKRDAKRDANLKEMKASQEHLKK